MSTSIMAACWPLQMPPTPKAVLISLADNANDQGECWPSIPKICERTCFSERTVHGAIQWLESAGLVTADRSNGRHTRYLLSPDAYVNAEKPPQELRHRSKCAAAGDAAKPPQELRLPPQEMQSPPQELRSNHQEPSLTVKSNRQPRVKTPDLSSWPGSPSPTVLADWLSMRKRQRADVTPTVIEGFARQLQAAVKAGHSVDDCLTECVMRNWRGFKAGWMDGNARAGPSDSARPSTTSAASRPL